MDLISHFPSSCHELSGAGGKLWLWLECLMESSGWKGRIYLFFSPAQPHSGTFPQGCLGPFSSAAKFTFLVSEFSWNIKLQGWRQARSKQCDQQLGPPGSVCTTETLNSFSWQCWDQYSLDGTAASHKLCLPRWQGTKFSSVHKVPSRLCFSRDLMPRTKINKSQAFPGVELAELRSPWEGWGDIPGWGRGAAAGEAVKEPLELPMALEQPGHPCTTGWNTTTWKRNSSSCLEACRWWSGDREEESNQQQTETWHVDFK